MKTKSKTGGAGVPSSHSKSPTVTVRQRIFSVIAFNQYRLLVRAEKNDYDRHMKLVHGLSFVVTSIASKDAGNLRDVLQRIAAWCIGWVENVSAGDILTAVHHERERQQELLRQGKFSFICASPVADPKRKLAVLVEEVGEVAKAIIEMDERKATPNELHAELIQVAAVCVAWLESLEAPGGAAKSSIVNRKCL